MAMTSSMSCATAFDDEEGNAVNYHNTNYMTFHRLEDFRTLASKILAL